MVEQSLPVALFVKNKGGCCKFVVVLHIWQEISPNKTGKKFDAAIADLKFLNLKTGQGDKLLNSAVGMISRMTSTSLRRKLMKTRSLSISFQDTMANAVSGTAVQDECKLKFLELKAKRNYRFIIFKIDGQEVVVEKLGSPQESYDDFSSSLPADECRYAVFDFDFITNENCQKSKIFFIAWSPESSSVRMKMVYASSKDRFKRELDGIQVELQATDPSEMSFDLIKSRAY
ncbi:hypothetical protein HAX54_036073 [Datura stramonium]|uniref:ADF-H domain-containing protein n=1 Tax=Datura stramonium TaxID=4076 RepID=A0ABS8SG52_DATST|nr:hypothetical protein [Datura stramonium]